MIAGHSSKANILWFVLFVAGNAVVIGATELSYDEAYYWLWSRYLDWGYFDHPPLIAWLIASTATWISGEVGVRLGPCLSVAAAAWAVSRALVPSERQWAWWAGWLVFPLISIASFMALPDAALLTSELLFFLALKRFIERDSACNALVVGLTCALLLYAKYHGVLLILGALLAAPELLRRKHFWRAALTGLLLFVPHLLWQWRHDFVTFNYHLFQGHHGRFSWQRPLLFLLQQLFCAAIFLAPWVWWRAVHVRRDDVFERALAGMTFSTLLVFFICAFFKSVQGNWTVAAYPCLLLLVVRAPGAAWPERLWFRALGVTSAALMVAFKLLLTIPGTETYVPRLAELRGWRGWSRALARATPDCALAANTHQIAAKLSFYAERQVTSLNFGGRPNQFDLWRWEQNLLDKPLCWLTATGEFPGEIWVTPRGSLLRLVRGLQIEQIDRLKQSAIGAATKRAEVSQR